MLVCPKCTHNISIKSGFAKGRHRWKCKGCSYYYTVKKCAGKGNEKIRRQALQLYLEGLGFRAIGRILKFSHVAYSTG